MRTMEMQELKEHIGEVLEYVQAGETIEITDHDEVVARVVPAQQSQRVRPLARDENGAWAKLNALIGAISADWPEGVSAPHTMKDVRRDL